MKLFIMQSHSLPCYLLPLRPKHPVLGHPQRLFLPQSERPVFATDKLVVPYVLMSILLASKPENKGVCTERY